jgi:hypothetical protein
LKNYINQQDTPTRSSLKNRLMIDDYDLSKSFSLRNDNLPFRYMKHTTVRPSIVSEYHVNIQDTLFSDGEISDISDHET